MLMLNSELISGRWPMRDLKNISSSWCRFLNLDQMHRLWNLKSPTWGSCIRYACLSECCWQAGVLNRKSIAQSKINEKESFIGVIYSKIAILEKTLTSHLVASRREHTRHTCICGILKDLGGPGSFHNSFQSLNTLAPGNSSLYLTYRPPPAVNTHFRFLCLQSGWGTAG